jgi:hypothetical protein
MASDTLADTKEVLSIIIVADQSGQKVRRDLHKNQAQRGLQLDSGSGKIGSGRGNEVWRLWELTPSTKLFRCLIIT